MKILVADDDPINRRLLQVFLGEWGYEVILAGDGEQAWSILRGKDAPQLAILDWMMPGMDGTRICGELRKRTDDPYIYIILLTAKFQKTDLIAGLDAGADDYLTKPFQPAELQARLRAGRRIIDLQQQLRSSNEQLKFQAAHDPLTGLANHAAILNILKIELARAQRQRTTIGILMADLDHFKDVNDTYGHLVGDAVLRELARRMLENVRPYDSVGRYGGEEFLIILPGCDLSSANRRAENLCAAVDRAPVDVSATPVHITVSLGVAIGGAETSEDVGTLVRAADAALYEAKSKGRNCVEVFGGEGEEFAPRLRKSGTKKIAAAG